jgi:hypothetical protein
VVVVFGSALLLVGLLRVSAQPRDPGNAFIAIAMNVQAGQGFAPNYPPRRSALVNAYYHLCPEQRRHLSQSDFVRTGGNSFSMAFSPDQGINGEGGPAVPARKGHATIYFATLSVGVPDRHWKAQMIDAEGRWELCGIEQLASHS